MTPRSTSRVAVRVYIASTWAAALFLLAVVWAIDGLPSQGVWLLVLSVVGLILGVDPPKYVGHTRWGVASIATLAAMPLLGPIGAAAAAVGPVFFMRIELEKRLFNVAMRIIWAVTGSLAYLGVGGILGLHRVGEGPIEPWKLAVSMAAAGVTTAAMNTLLLGGVVRLASGVPLRSTAVDLRVQMVVGFAAYTVVAFLITVLWAIAGLGWFSAVLIIPPLLVGEWGVRQYLFERQVRRQILRSLAEALEVRSPGSRAHGHLVGDVAGAVAQSLGVSSRGVEAVSTAGRLHDMGLLMMPPKLLDSRSAMSDETAHLMAAHPDAARAILGPIDFLRRPLDLISSHHERFDGAGYPRGLSGEEIPLGARILATADAFVSFRRSPTTGSATSSQDALTRCEDLAGSALDPRCVQALRRALDRDAFSVEPEGPDAGVIPFSTSDVASAETTARIGEMVGRG